MIRLSPRGLIVNLVTPVDPEGRPDERAMFELMQRLGEGPAGFLAGGFELGEAEHLGADHRLRVLEASLQGCPGHMSLLFDITARTEAETMDLVKRADRRLSDHRSGAMVFYYLTPLTYHRNRDLPQHIRDLGAASARSIILANNPALVRRVAPTLRHKNIRTAVLKKISANKQIAGLASTGDLQRAINYQRALKTRTDLRFYDHQEDNFLERPSSSGLISQGANLIPRVWSDIVGSSLNLFDIRRTHPRHISRIRKSGFMARTLISAYQPNPPAAIKKALELMGVLPDARLTVGAEPLSPFQEQAIKDALTDLGLI